MNSSKWFLVIIIGAALILGSASLALAQDDNAAIFERYIKAIWNRGHFAVFGVVMSPDSVHHDSTLPEPVTGTAAIVDYVQKHRSDLPDMDFAIDSLSVEGDMVTADLTATIRDASEPLEARARIADGRVVETWFDVNLLAANPDMMAAVAEVEADNLAVVDQFIEFNQNLAAYATDLRLFSAKYTTFYDSSYLEHGFLMNGRTATASAGTDFPWYQAVNIAFPDLEWTAENVVVHRDTVYTHYSSTGTFQNPWEMTAFGNWITIQPTGKKVTESGVIIHRIEDGKIVEMWWYVDSPAFWSEVALMLERGFGWDSVAHEIYNLNNPK